MPREKEGSYGHQRNKHQILFSKRKLAVIDHMRVMPGDIKFLCLALDNILHVTNTKRLLK